ncbi:MAG: DNA repair and recombination protein RadB [Methanomethylovorans sp.]|nr:DNA repair and recombination protein RadB [Methanomethylovorans sp.]
MVSHLTSGCKSLDTLLEGGLETGVVTQFFGEAGSGKTNICLQLAIRCVEQGKKVIIIDTEGISPTRFRQIAGERAKEIAQNILIYEPHNFEEQHAAVRELEKVIKENIGLIVVDSATAFYRFELEQEDSAVRARRELGSQIGFLHNLARKYGIVVVITNQVYTDVATGTLRPVGGNIIEHISKTIIQLERLTDGKRRAILKKHRSLPEGISCEFTITSAGVE